LGALKVARITLLHLSGANWLIRRVHSRHTAIALMGRRHHETPSRGPIVFVSSSHSIYQREYDDAYRKPQG